MDNVLLIDFGSTYTKVTAVDINSERILGTARACTTSKTDINEGLNNALADLEGNIGKIEYNSKFACSSAAGGLKMVVIGIVPELTVEAAKLTALSAGAKVIGVYSYELTDDEANEIANLKPDIVLLTGGTDGGNKNIILHNAEILASIESDFPVVVAGNKSVASKVAEILKSAGKEVRVCQNVMPEFNKLNIEPARQTIRDIFLQRIIRAKGLTKVQNIIEGILMPTPSAVLKAVQILSTGYGTEKGLGDLMAIDVGGATTDVYSISDGLPSRSGVIIKGLPEPFAKRTVEGDLGVRYSADFIVEEAGVKMVCQASGLTLEEVQSYLNKIRSNPGILPNDDNKIGMLDLGLAKIVVKEAVKRHTGVIETSYTPMGKIFIQKGKDLTGIRKVIGTGGPVINSLYPGEIMKGVLFDEREPEILRPINADFFIDRKYILSAMGLLSEKYPEIAVRIMKRELEMV
ncbi:MAG TPA: MutL protein [Clostridiaceae bacterium]|nr:MutL protein [Clostridiaceae bacterium]